MAINTVTINAGSCSFRKRMLMLWNVITFRDGGVATKTTLCQPGYTCTIDNVNTSWSLQAVSSLELEYTRWLCGVGTCKHVSVYVCMRRPGSTTAKPGYDTYTILPEKLTPLHHTVNYAICDVSSGPKYPLQAVVALCFLGSHVHPEKACLNTFSYITNTHSVRETNDNAAGFS